MTNSQIQQETIDSTQALILGLSDMREIGEFIGGLESAIGDLKLSTEKTNEILAEIRSIKAQLGSPHPKKKILAECLKSVRTILENAAGDLIASGLLTQLNVLLGSLPR